VTTTPAAARLIGEVDRPNVRIQYDCYHMQRMEGNLTATLDAYRDLIDHIQIADSPDRHEPGTGEINYRYVLDHIDRLGYTGYIGLEYRPSTAGVEASFGWLESFGRPRWGETA
jgi:hydroxypyruvate isomerase